MATFRNQNLPRNDDRSYQEYVKRSLGNRTLGGLYQQANTIEGQSHNLCPMDISSYQKEEEIAA